MMKITKRQLKRIIKEERAKLVSERYLDSSEEKAMAKKFDSFAGDTILDLEMLIDQNYGRFTDDENKTLAQAVQILNSRLGG
tara:strand:- start:1906 stop:2151 length:246 start_codon:yes stop_codon:yes gene_type:complete